MSTFSPRGTGAAIVAPFTSDDTIDLQAFRNICRHGIDGGLDYLVILGSTGEAPTLSEAEKMELVENGAETARGKAKVVVGLSGNHTKEVVRGLSKPWMQHADALMLLCPYYNKPSQEGLYQHFSAVAEQTGLPIVIYNILGRTGINMLPETMLRLASSHKNIVGVKEASGNLDQCLDLLAAKPSSFTVVSGDDPYTLSYMAAGMEGVISVVAQAFPKQVSSLVNHCLGNDFDKARQEHARLLPITKALFREGNPAGIKALLAEMGYCKAHVRLPLTEASTGLKAQLAHEWAKLQQA